jgi:hypothetical protein
MGLRSREWVIAMGTLYLTIGTVDTGVVKGIPVGGAVADGLGEMEQGCYQDE